jgi:hypothetical protein
VHNLKRTTQTILLMLAVALLLIPPTTLHIKSQNRPQQRKSVAVLRKQGQPAMLPTAQEVIDSERGKFGQAEKVRAFRSGRDLLLKKGVPFEPNVLLEENWREKLKGAFGQMPEFQEARRGGKKLKGAQVADTLFLPEKVYIEGDTVILARRLVFEGKDVFIKGNHAVHIFTIEPTTLTETVARGSQVQFFNASFKASPELRRLASTLRPVQNGHITIDTSGIGRKEWIESRRQRGTAATTSQSEASMVKAGFTSGIRSEVTQVSQDKSGRPGADGVTGEGGLPGTNGEGGANGVNGVCGGNVNGTDGFEGGGGGIGYDGKNGGPGDNGTSGEPITVNIAAGDTQSYTLTSKGGDGGWGGDGGAGGTGGRGGEGGKGGNGADCLCTQGGSGAGGRGGGAGRGGDGADGGTGGNGGNGGNGGPINITYAAGYDINKVHANAPAGFGGRGGAQGTGGFSGTNGVPGKGGSGASGARCPGTAGQGGMDGSGPIYPASYGKHGGLGLNGQNGTSGNLNFTALSSESSGGSAGVGSKGGNLQSYDYYQCTTYYWVLYNSWNDGQTWFEVDRWYAGCW